MFWRERVSLLAADERKNCSQKEITIVEVTLIDGTKITERVEAVRGTAETR